MTSTNELYIAEIKDALYLRIEHAVSILRALEHDVYDETDARDDLFDLCEGSPDGLVHALTQLAYKGEK